VRFAAAAAVALMAATCDDYKPFECTKPADCVGRPDVNACKILGGKGRCVQECLVANGTHNCPPTYECTGKADDNSTYCVKER
jgi:hypothetical protein